MKLEDLDKTVDASTVFDSEKHYLVKLSRPTELLGTRYNPDKYHEFRGDAALSIRGDIVSYKEVE